MCEGGRKLVIVCLCVCEGACEGEGVYEDKSVSERENMFCFSHFFNFFLFLLSFSHLFINFQSVTFSDWK